MQVGSVVLLAAVGGSVLYGIGLYNGLVAGRNRFRQAFAHIDVQLQRRYDLIPNLVEAARGYMQHERETLDAVTNARGRAQSAARDASLRPDDAHAIVALGVAEGALGGALGRFYAVAEAYPDLKANASIAALMQELSASENRISAARQQFNDAVTDYNNQREQFPGNLVAGPLGFAPAELLELADPSARAAPRIAFG